MSVYYPHIQTCESLEFLGGKKTPKEETAFQRVNNVGSMYYNMKTKESFDAQK